MKVFPFLSGFGARVRRAAAWAALASAMALGTAAVADGLKINGDTVDFSSDDSGDGWSYAYDGLFFARTVTINGDGMSFDLTGNSGNNPIKVDADCTITVGDFMSQVAFLVTANHTLNLVVQGTNNVFQGSTQHPGLEVAAGGALVICGDGGALAATAGEGAAGIGSRWCYPCGDITIALTNGTVTATGKGGGAGIGGGYGGPTANITISEGTVVATGGPNAPGIGSGTGASCGTVTITGGDVTATGGSLSPGIGCGNTWDSNTNTVSGGTIIISGGTVHATGGESGAGIGGGKLTEAADVTISGGEVHAMGGVNAAGIGGGEEGSGGSFAITDGTVVATGGYCGAGIGGGQNGAGGSVTISGGKVTATGGDGGEYQNPPENGGAGIGGGNQGDGGTVAITGGEVEANGGNYNGAGIGGGDNGEGGNITISGGTVKATGGYRGAGIGGGNNRDGGTIVIDGGDVTAAGMTGAAGIGGGNNGNGGSITIKGGTVSATADGGFYGAGIGGGCDGDGGVIAIENGIVTANSCGSGAGIGGGGHSTNDITCGTITISGGSVTALAATTAACIGTGYHSSGGTITISGGIIDATVFTHGAGIGGGEGGGGIAVSISGGTINANSIGDGKDHEGAPGTNTFTGGAIFATLDDVSPAAVNATPTNVFPITFNLGVSNAIVTNFTGYVDYGIKDASTDENGDIVFWLPPSGGTKEIAVTLDGESEPHEFFYRIDDDGTVSIPDTLTVNGTTIAGGLETAGDGWTCDANGVVTMTNASLTYTVQGESTNGYFQFFVPDGAAGLELDGLTFVSAAAENVSGFSLAGTVPVTVKGENIIAALGDHAGAIALDNGADVTISGDGALTLAGLGKYCAGINVTNDAHLTIDSEGLLVANGGKFGAGIGSRGGNAPCGFIEIRSGKVVATGGDNAAGIGGGGNSNLREGSIVISGGVVTGHGGAYAAGIGAGRGSFRLPDGAVRISGGSVSAHGDLTTAEPGSLKGSFSRSDFAESQENVVPLVENEFKSIVITGGSVVPATLEEVSPRPVDDGSNLLYRVLMKGFDPGSAVAITSDGIPPDYSTEGIVADAGGCVCLWMRPSDTAIEIEAGGKLYRTPEPFDHDVTLDDGSDIPESITDGTNTLWLVTVPGLEPHVHCDLSIQAEKTVELFAESDDQGQFFFYVADGEYTFQLNDLDFFVVVDGAPATALRYDPDDPTGVLVDGTDVCNGFGKGWLYDSGSSELLLSGESFVLSGSNTEGRVQIAVATTNLTLTLSNLTLAVTNAAAAIAIPVDGSVLLVLAGTGTNTLSGGRGHAAIEVPIGATLEIGGEGDLRATGGVGAAGIGGSDVCGNIKIACAGGIRSQGRDDGAGIGSGLGGTTGTVTIESGKVTAIGGDSGPGIGGGNSVGTIAISGGEVHAAGGDLAAGIGGGGQSVFGQFSIAISGGRIVAEGGKGAVGIGGTTHASEAVIAISGGTVYPKGGTNATAPLDIGIKYESYYHPLGTNTFTGGTIFTSADAVSPAAGDAAGAAAWPVEVPGLPPSAAVTNLAITEDAAGAVGYGTKDIYADETGRVILWLPDGDYALDVEGTAYIARVAGKPTTAIRADTGHPTGVFAGGTDVCNGVGKGWFYDYTTSALTLYGDGLVLSGTNTEGRVQIAVETNLTLTLSNLTLAATGEAAPLAISSGVNATLTLAGTNALSAGKNHAGIEVPDGAQLGIGGDGTLAAHGGENAAGIGAGYDNACGIVTIGGGTVTATGGKNGAGIGACLNGKTGGSVAVAGGTVTANGGDGNAGIGGIVDTVAISGGIVTATGGSGAAGIGADAATDAVCPAIEISGGSVSAVGGSGAAGIGGGQASPGTSISISGGYVVAQGLDGGAGIGGGIGRSGGAIAISGGTIHVSVQTPGQDPVFIGDGSGSDLSGSNTFTGGTIFATDELVRPFAVNAGGAQVWPVTLKELPPNAPVSGCAIFDGDGNPFAYGTQDLFASGDGTLVLWLPNGTYTLQAGGFNYSVTVEDGPAIASRSTGVFVNGIDVVAGSGDGWSFDWNTLQLVLSGDNLVLSGTNVHGIVQVSVEAGVSAVTISNLTLAAATNSAAISLASGVSAKLNLVGKNTLCGGQFHPAVEVPGDAALEITGDGRLDATGGQFGAGIGGGASCGSITISGGTVNATGSQFGAGIGGGGNGSGGTIVINGGTVTATGGDNGAGIGGGSTGSGGSIAINGGTVAATGGQEGAGIGGGGNGSGGTVAITGGRVLVTNGDRAACIGGGNGGAAADVSISGGTIEFALKGSYLFAIGCGMFSGYFPPSGGSTRIDGGCVLLTDTIRIQRDPVNADGAHVYPVEFQGLPPRYPIFSVSVGGHNYGTKDLFVSDEGEFVLWLPDGQCVVTVNGLPYNADVNGAATVAVLDSGHVFTGVLVDGIDAGQGGPGNGRGWQYDRNSRRLDISGSDIVLSGMNTNGDVCVHLGTQADVTVSNLTLAVADETAAISFENDWDEWRTLTLLGENSLSGGTNHPAIEVRGNESLFIYGKGSLSATGGENAAGIGGASQSDCGDITIVGVTVMAQGGDNGAGIGGGCEETGWYNRTITLSNCTVTATGGNGAAGIGGGYHGSGGTITIHGGIVIATGGENAAGIGSGDGSWEGYHSYDVSSGEIEIHGGIVKATGGKNAAAIGAGKDGEVKSISISSGTITPVSPDNSCAIGVNTNSAASGNIKFNGGSILTTFDMVNPSPYGGDYFTQLQVQPFTFVNLKPGAPVKFSGLPSYYDATDIYADAEGKVVLWLRKNDGGGVTPIDNKYTIFANGYEYTVSFDGGGGVNAAPGDGSVTTVQGRALPLENLEITGYSCDGGTVTLDVVAEPATWTHGFADTLSVRRADSLVPGAQDAPVNATPVLSSDGTVSFSLPVNPANRTSFFFISAPGEE